MTVQAVLTGDIVHSTRLSAGAEKKLLKKLSGILMPHRFEFYRGDSFQAYLEDAGDALQTALLCRTSAIGLAAMTPAFSPDIRISIGIAKNQPPGQSVTLAKGEAFVLSGRSFDQLLKKEARLAITSLNPLGNEGLQVIADYADGIFTSMTARQALVISELLTGDTQQAVALKLKKSKSTIHQHATAARWTTIEKLLRHYHQIINLLP